jgi:hypothetical protein
VPENRLTSCQWPTGTWKSDGETFSQVIPSPCAKGMLAVASIHGIEPLGFRTRSVATRHRGREAPSRAGSLRQPGGTRDETAKAFRACSTSGKHCVTHFFLVPF